MHPNSLLSDRQLRQLLSKNPQAAIPHLFEQYYTMLCQTVVRIVADPQLAEDVVQDLFMRLLEGKRSVATDGSIGAYLRRMAVNAALDHLRSKAGNKQFENEARLEVVHAAQHADYNIREADMQQAVDQVLKQLPDRCRAVFVLSRLEEKSYREISAELGISVNTVENQMVKALKALRKALSHHLPVLF